MSLYLVKDAEAEFQFEFHRPEEEEKPDEGSEEEEDEGPEEGEGPDEGPDEGDEPNDWSDEDDEPDEGSDEDDEPSGRVTLHLDDAYTSFTDEDLHEAFRGEPTRKKLGKSGERLPLWISFGMHQPSSRIFMMAAKEAIDYLAESHPNVELQLIVNLKFENGYNTFCKMNKCRIGRPYFYGFAELYPTKMFVAGQTYRCHTTVELIDKAAFNFLEISDTCPFNKKLLEEKRFCDFNIVAENGAAIQCHKHFLAARSPVFDRMLHTSCVETRENRCKMDVSEAVINAFLQFVYCSDLTKVFESPTGTLAVEMLELGHKYDIPLLEESTKKLLLKRDAEWLDGDASWKLFNYSAHKEGEDYQRLNDKGRRVVELHED